MKNLLSIFMILSAMNVNADDFVIDSTSDYNLIQFESTAKLEFIEGETNDIIGLIKFNPIMPYDTIFAIIKVDLRHLKTGIETRDEHMRNRHLHTDDYPYAFFELLKTTNMPRSIVSDSSYNINGEGYFYIHGVKRKLNPDIELKWDKDNNNIYINAKFRIELEKYEIPRPKALFLKLAEIIEVNVKFIGYGDLSPPDINPPDYPELH
jgi:polyisoprenoid-binding protein YceI